MGEFPRRAVAAELDQTVTLKNQLADKVDKFVELVSLNAHGLGRRRALGSFRLPRRRVTGLNRRVDLGYDNQWIQFGWLGRGGLLRQENPQIVRRCLFIFDRWVRGRWSGARFLRLLQLRQQGIELILLQSALANVLEHAAHLITGRKKQVHDAAVKFEATIAQGFEHVFGTVAQANEGIESQEPCSSLNGVQGAEDAIQQFTVARRRLQGDHVLVHALQEFLGFNEEITYQRRILCEIVVHSNAPPA